MGQDKLGTRAGGLAIGGAGEQWHGWGNRWQESTPGYQGGAVCGRDSGGGGPAASECDICWPENKSCNRVFREVHLTICNGAEVVVDPSTRILKSVYFPTENILMAEVGKSPSQIWRSITEGRDILKKGWFDISGMGRPLTSGWIGGYLVQRWCDHIAISQSIRRNGCLNW